MLISRKLLGAAGLVALMGFAAVGAADAAALHQSQTPGTTQPANPRIVRVAGKIQSMSANGLVLQAGRNRTVNVNTSADTWVLVDKNNRCTEGALSDLQTGKPAEVAGTSTSTTNTIDGRVVAQGRCAVQINRRLAGLRGRAALAVASRTGSGTIQSISGGTLTLTAANGKPLTVNTTANTVVFNNGFSTVASLKAGDKVQVLGKATPASASANRTIDAWALHSDSAGTKMMLAHVQKVDGSVVTLRTRAHPGGVALTLDANTGYRFLTISGSQATLTQANQADVKAGGNLAVEATVSADGKTATAEAVVILPSRPLQPAQP